MSDSKNNPVSLILFLLVVFFLMLLVVPALASGPDVEQEVTTGDVSVVGDKSSAFAVGGADYDIGRGSCKFHWGGLTFAISNNDEFCQGMELIRAGFLDAGILHICKQTDVGRNYKTLADCQTGMAQVEPTTNQLPIETELVIDEDDEDDDRYEKLAEQLAVVQEQQQIQARPQVTRQVIQQPYLSDEKKAKLREAIQ